MLLSIGSGTTYTGGDIVMTAGLSTATSVGTGGAVSVTTGEGYKTTGAASAFKRLSQLEEALITDSRTVIRCVGLAIEVARADGHELSGDARIVTPRFFNLRQPRRGRGRRRIECFVLISILILILIFICSTTM